MKSVKTKKGTELPLMSLKGKDYLMVAYRLQWLVEEEPNFKIETKFHEITDGQTVCTAHVSLLNEKGEVTKSATGTKRETKTDFSDHTEKAETGAIGRALAMLGYGTQFAIADLDEGSRLADAPVVNLKDKPTYTAPTKNQATATVAKVPTPVAALLATTSGINVSTADGALATVATSEASPKKTTFKKAAKTETAPTPAVTSEGDWQ